MKCLLGCHRSSPSVIGSFVISRDRFVGPQQARRGDDEQRQRPSVLARVRGGLVFLRKVWGVWRGGGRREKRGQPLTLYSLLEKGFVGVSPPPAGNPRRPDLVAVHPA